MKTHKDLDVWKKAMGLARLVYDETRKFPASEAYGLTSQMRRAAVSVPSNIAEGAARGGSKEFIRFLRIALGSLAELETQIILSADLSYSHEPEGLLQEMEDVRKLTLGLIRHLEARKVESNG
ncbi:MAG: four helix bundle protein [Deltaproteobacteria bacterium]